MALNRHAVLNRHSFRILALLMFAFPEPIVSNSLGVALLIFSFMLPSLEGNEGRACACGCDYHCRCMVHEYRVMGAGALVQVRRLIAPKLPLHYGYHAERYGFGPMAVPAQPAGSLRNSTVSGCEFPSYRWYKWPKLEGALLRRLSGFGGRTAVKCELNRSAAMSRA